MYLNNYSFILFHDHIIQSLTSGRSFKLVPESFNTMIIVFDNLLSGITRFFCLCSKQLGLAHREVWPLPSASGRQSQLWKAMSYLIEMSLLGMDLTVGLATFDSFTGRAGHVRKTNI